MCETDGHEDDKIEPLIEEGISIVAGDGVPILISAEVEEHYDPANDADDEQEDAWNLWDDDMGIGILRVVRHAVSLTDDDSSEDEDEKGYDADAESVAMEDETEGDSSTSSRLNSHSFLFGRNRPDDNASETASSADNWSTTAILGSDDEYIVYLDNDADSDSEKPCLFRLKTDDAFLKCAFNNCKHGQRDAGEVTDRDEPLPGPQGADRGICESYCKHDIGRSSDTTDGSS